MRYVITCLVTRNTLLPLVVLVCPLVVLSHPPVVLIRLSTRGTRVFIRSTCLSTRTRLSTRSICLATRSTRRIICRSFYN